MPILITSRNFMALLYNELLSILFCLFVFAMIEVQLFAFEIQKQHWQTDRLKAAFIHLLKLQIKWTQQTGEICA